MPPTLALDLVHRVQGIGHSIAIEFINPWPVDVFTVDSVVRDILWRPILLEFLGRGFFNIADKHDIAAFYVF